MKMLIAAAALAALVASPAFAQRAALIGACSAMAGKYTEYTWGDMEIQQYRACMAEHGQAE
jgi:hypothetical protein